MNNLLAPITESLSLLFKDKVNLVFLLIPFFIALALYSVLGVWLYESVFIEIKQWVDSQFSAETWGVFFNIVIGTLLTVLALVLTNFTFVLVVTLIGSPFYDLISERVEQKVRGKKLSGFQGSFGKMLGRLGKTLINEVKKLSFIVVLNILALLFGLVGILLPLAFVLSALLITIGFIDYTWARHDLSVGRCIKECWSRFFPYTLVGAALLTLINIPVLNLLIPPFAVTYFTIYWVRRDMQTNQKAI